MASSMTVRTMETSELGSFPFPVTMNRGAMTAQPAAIPAPGEECATDEVPTAAGCLRGLWWALTFEAAAALMIYGGWRLFLILR
jgi:hypothetical protein